MKRIGACLPACLKFERWPSKAREQSNKKRRKTRALMKGREIDKKRDYPQLRTEKSNEIHPFSAVLCQKQNTVL
jgi:hypothetical protein